MPQLQVILFYTPINSGLMFMDTNLRRWRVLQTEEKSHILCSHKFPKTHQTFLFVYVKTLILHRTDIECLTKMGVVKIVVYTPKKGVVGQEVERPVVHL